MFIFLSSTALLQYGRGDFEVPGQGLSAYKVSRLRGNRTERTLKSQLSFDWTHWLVNDHKDAPLGRFLDDIRHSNCRG